MADIIQIRRDTAANWASVNPVLAQGEMGLETDTEKMKLGDGVTSWNSLNYFITTQGSVAITGGTIDGTVIGGTTPAAVTTSSLVATTADINGGTIDGTSVGASTPGTGVFTSLETEGAFTEDAEAITSSSGTATIDLSTATNFTHTLSENVTYTFSNPAASGKASSFTLKVTQDATARTITWPASVNWAGGTAPTLSTGSGEIDYFAFITTDNGTAYYGFTAGQALASP